MAGNNVRVNTDQVSQIASNLERLNKRLTEELTNSKATVDALASIWEGEAAQTQLLSMFSSSEPTWSRAISKQKRQILDWPTHSNNRSSEHRERRTLGALGALNILLLDYNILFE